MRYELADYELAAIKPMLPNKPRGVPRVNDRRVLNGILWVLRSGAPWRDLPDAFGPYTTCYNRLVHWRRAGVWSRIIDARAAAHERWFAELTRKHIQRGVHTSVRQLEADIRTFIDLHNKNPKPFKWTKSADQILASVKRFCHKAQQTLCGEL